ncbi:MAG: FAD-dependent oxidoreductase [Armatimonadetes bacterium]|nr:FAD-dependent oxidoreductase [Armatimonadota bacterium]
MSECITDVAVIGAGPAGAATAIFLARQGYDVTLLDRALFPRPKPCGEYLTPGAVRLLRDELGVLPALLAQGAAWLTQERVVPHGGRCFEGPTSALACPRVVMDQVLRDRAEECGVRVREGFAARKIIWNSGAVAGVVGTGGAGESETVRARVTAGADGTHSLLARALGVIRPLPRLHRLALVGHFPAADDDPPAVTMHLPRDRSDACCGVGAACGPGRTRNINIVVPASEASLMAGRREDYFRERLRRSFPEVWELVQGAAPSGPLQSVGCFGHHTARASQDGAVLVGDAATFIHPFTGEGVFFALCGAQLAAEAIDVALRQGDVSRRTLSHYDAARRRDLMPRYRLCDAVQHIVHSPPLLAWAAERLRRSASLTEIVLQTVGDIARPTDLFSLPTLRLALGTG